MNRKLWTRAIFESQIPAWECPECKTGHTTIVRESFIHKELARSKKAHGHEYWDPDWIELIFTTQGLCSNEQCKQDFIISGIGGLESYIDDEDGQQWQEYFTPKICLPMPNIFRIPEKCPENIKDTLSSAFSSFLSNNEACAGRIRVALEMLLTHLGVPTQTTNAKGETYDLKLHARVDIFSKTDPTTGANLMALKWLGNTGSHDGEVTKNDLLDAFEVFEHALEEVIEHRSKRVTELAAKLTAAHKGK